MVLGLVSKAGFRRLRLETRNSAGSADGLANGTFGMGHARAKQA